MKTIYLLPAACLLLIGCPGGSSSRATVDGLVLHLPFDGSSQETGPFGFDTTENGAPLTFADGVRGQCAVFDLKSWVDVDNDERASLTGGGTLEMWLKGKDWENGPWNPCPASCDALIVGLGGGPSVGMRVEGKTRQMNTKTRLRSEFGAVPMDAWFHVALVYDKETSKLSLYLDGELADEEATKGSLGTPAKNQVRVGTWYKTNQAYEGLIDELKLYNVPRTPEQIRQSAKRY